MPHGQVFYNQIRSGGVLVKTISYSAVEADAWKEVIFNAAGATTYTLLSPPPSGLWRVTVANIGAGLCTISRNGLTIDGAASDIILSTNQSTTLWSDGVNYFSDRGAGTLLLQNNGVNNGLQSKLNLKNGTNITMTDDGLGNITINAAGGGGGAMAQIGQVVLVAAAASITFSSIPNTYTNLLLGFAGRGDNATNSVNVQMQLNSDTAANYSWIFGSVNNGSGSFSATVQMTVATIAAASATANYPGTFLSAINNYAGTVFFKQVISDTVYRNSATAAAGDRMTFGGDWLSTAAISAIKIFPTTGNFIIGTKATLWGLT